MSTERQQRARLARSSSAVLAGVCGGIAEFLGWQPNGIRWMWVAGTLLTGIVGGMIVYTVAAIIMPRADEPQGRLRLEDFREQ